MSKHFISKAAMNSAEALTDAMHVWEKITKADWDVRGVQELIEIINISSISLKTICREIALERREKSRLAGYIKEAA